VVNYDGATADRNTGVFPDALIGKEPDRASATARQPVFVKTITIGQNCSIGHHAVIYDNVLIGDNTLLGDCASVHENAGSDPSASPSVLDNRRSPALSVITPKSWIARTSQAMPRWTKTCSSAYWQARPMTTPYVPARVSPTSKAPPSKPTPSIGVGASQLPGLTIGERANIGAGIVVTKTVDAGQTPQDREERASRRPLSLTSQPICHPPC